jgi:hypothetical protein
MFFVTLEKSQMGGYLRVLGRGGFGTRQLKPVAWQIANGRPHHSTIAPSEGCYPVEEAPSSLLYHQYTFVSQLPLFLWTTSCNSPFVKLLRWLNSYSKTIYQTHESYTPEYVEIRDHPMIAMARHHHGEAFLQQERFKKAQDDLGRRW